MAPWAPVSSWADGQVTGGVGTAPGVTESDLAKAGYSYADATPGHPVKLRGELIARGDGYGVVFERVGR